MISNQSKAKAKQLLAGPCFATLYASCVFLLSDMIGCFKCQCLRRMIVVILPISQQSKNQEEKSPTRNWCSWLKRTIQRKKKTGCYTFNLPHRHLSFCWEFLRTRLVKPPWEITEKLAKAKRCSIILKQTSEMQVKSRTKVPLGWPFGGWQICEVSVTKKETN